MCSSGACPAAAVTAAAIALAEGRSTDEVNFLGALFTQLGDTLLTIAASREFCSDKQAPACGEK